MKKFLIALLLIPTLFIGTSGVSAAPTSLYPDVESQIFAIQKGFIQDIRTTLQLDLAKGVKQSGKMAFKTKINSPEASGAINVQFEEYQTLYDANSKNVEVAYRGYMELEIHGSDYDYDSYDEETYSYDKIPFDFYATVNFDAKAILLADGTSFIKLVKFDGRSHGKGDMKIGFDEMIVSAQKYVGKMYKIPQTANSSSGIDSLLLQKNLVKILDTLESKPLFVVTSKVGESYVLNYNKNTVKALGTKMTKSSKDTITYTMKPNGGVIRLAEKRNPKNNYLTLTQENGNRAFDLAIKTLSKSTGKLDMKTSIAKEMIFIDIRDKSTTFLLNWRNSKFDMVIKNKPRTTYGTSPAFDLVVQGDLAFDGSRTNLTLLWGGKSIGTITGKKIGNVGEYAMNLNIAVPLFSVLVDISGNFINELGDYKISPPTIYELLKNI